MPDKIVIPGKKTYIAKQGAAWAIRRYPNKTWRVRERFQRRPAHERPSINNIQQCVYMAQGSGEFMMIRTVPNRLMRTAYTEPLV